AAEVVDRDLALLLLLEPIGERRRSRLVDDAQDFQTGDLAGILGRLPLRIVEVGGNRDDGLTYLLAEIGFRRLLHLLEDERRYLRWRIGFSVGFDPGIAVRGLDDLVGDQPLVLFHHGVVVAAADQPLHSENGVGGIGHRLTLGRLTYQTLAVAGEGNDRWLGAHAFSVFDKASVLAVHHGNA